MVRRVVVAWGMLWGAASCSGIVGLDGLTFDGGTEAAGGTASTGGGDGPGAAGGGGRPDGPSVFVDQTGTDFNAGRPNGMVVVGDAVSLPSERTEGHFVSRVFDAERDVEVTAIEWLPGGAYGKPLPIEAEAGYPEHTLDLSTAVLVLDFDGPEVLADRTGTVANVEVVGAGFTLESGIFGQGYRDTLDTHLQFDVGVDGAFDFGTRDFTWAYWIKSDQPCVDGPGVSANKVHLGVEESDADDTHLWLGCSSEYVCEGSSSAGRLTGNLRTTTNENRGFCGLTRIDDGMWHHLALVKEGHSSIDDPDADTIIRLYVDGQLDRTETANLPAPAELAGPVPFHIGGFNGGQYESYGTFDDVVIDLRAWRPEDVRAAYARHAMNLDVRVRTCSEPTCEDGADWGEIPALMDAPDETLVPARRDVSSSPPGRYVQYRVGASNDRTSELDGPRFDLVRVFVRPSG